MAVEDKYSDSNLEAGKKVNPAFSVGAKTVSAIAIIEVAAADADTSVYRMFKNVPAEWGIKDIVILADAVTGGTDYDLGFYYTNAGAVVDKDALADGIDMSSGFAQGSATSGIAAVDIANSQKKIWQLAGASASTKKTGYDIALTANTVGTAAGTIAVKAEFIEI